MALVERRQHIAKTNLPKTRSLEDHTKAEERLAITRFQRARACEAVLLDAAAEAQPRISSPSSQPRATRLSALTDEVLDVAQWVGTNADQLPIGEYAPFAAARAPPARWRCHAARPCSEASSGTRRWSRPYLKMGGMIPRGRCLFRKGRPIQTLKRGAEIAGRAAGLGAAILLDVATDSVKENEKERATAVVDALVSLGPTFVSGPSIVDPLRTC